jgi:hypothetical protein
VFATHIVKVRKTYTNVVEKLENEVPYMGRTSEGDDNIKMKRKGKCVRRSKPT